MSHLRDIPVADVVPGDRLSVRGKKYLVRDNRQVAPGVHQLALEDTTRRVGQVQVRSDQRVHAQRQHHGGPRQNPDITIDEELFDRYRNFHGIDPDHVDEYKFWVPGQLKEIGACAVDVGYKSHTQKSSKGPHKYVHDFDGGVKLYRRAKKGEKADLTYKDGEFPTGLIVCGVNLGFTYKDKNGKLKEISIRNKKLAGGADTKGHADMLVVVQPSGVQYVIRGGNLEVSDWLRN